MTTEPGRLPADEVRDMFDRIAPRYDRINDLQSLGLHRVWKRRLVRLAEPAPGRPALESILALRLADLNKQLPTLEESVEGASAAGVDHDADPVQARLPILIGADLERGAGQQFTGATPLPPLAAIGSLDDLDISRRAAELTATPVGILSFSIRPTRCTRRGASSRMCAWVMVL